MANCHCNDCKKASGSGYTANAAFPETNVSISGEVKYFENKGGSGAAVNRGFCTNCGSQIFGKPAAMPGVLIIRAGTLDDLSIYKPQIDIFTSHATAWDVMDQDLAKATEMPT